MKKLSTNSINYEIVKNIYKGAKKEILGKFVSNKKHNVVSKNIKDSQTKFQKALDNANLYGTESLADYARICEGNLYNQYLIEEKEKYQNWLRRLESLDHQKGVRVFFPSLKSKSRTQEFVGPIRNLDGELSNSHSECLKFWSIYCEKLYSKTCNKNLFDYISIENMDLDSPINYDEFISSLKSLKNNKAPGSDFITNEDFKKFTLSG